MGKWSAPNELSVSYQLSQSLLQYLSECSYSYSVYIKEVETIETNKF